MTEFEDKYFTKFTFSPEQVEANLSNALRDLAIAKKDEFREVKFSYAYTALLKSGIALLSHYQIKTKSVPGHHIKIIEKLAQLLSDETITDMANVMRSKRNLDLYSGGVVVTEKECREYLAFAEKVVLKAKKLLQENS